MAFQISQQLSLALLFFQILLFVCNVEHTAQAQAGGILIIPASRTHELAFKTPHVLLTNRYHVDGKQYALFDYTFQGCS